MLGFVNFVPSSLSPCSQLVSALDKAVDPTFVSPDGTLRCLGSCKFQGHARLKMTGSGNVCHIPIWNGCSLPVTTHKLSKLSRPLSVPL